MLGPNVAQVLHIHYFGSLDLLIHVPFQLHVKHTSLQSAWHSYLTLSVLPGTHLHLSGVQHVRVKCLSQGFLQKPVQSGDRICTTGSGCYKVPRSSHRARCSDSNFKFIILLFPIYLVFSKLYNYKSWITFTLSFSTV